MIRHWIALAAFALVALPQAALACTPNPDPDMRPWKDRVAGSSPMFIGTVVEIRGADGQVWLDTPECETRGATKECEAYHYGSGTVVFDVEVPIIGITELTFTIEQGHGSDCMVEFRLGQRWLYAGNLNESPSMYLNESYDWQQAADARKAGAAN
jgi:hypothetical protein